MKRFPLPLFLRFFENHGLLDITHRPQWYVVPGGSREYIRAMLDTLGDRLTLHLNAPVQQVIRHDRGVDIAREGVTDTFDQVIFACHSAQALAMLASPTQAEREVLGISAGSVTRWCFTAIRAGCRCANARGRAGTTASASRIRPAPASPTT